MSRESKNLIVIVTALLSIGIVLLFSASAFYAGASGRFGDPNHFLKRQFMWVVFAGAAMIVAARVRLDFWRRFSVPIIAVAMVLLGMVFVPGVGTDHNTGARRWLQAGPFSLQPSEVAKVALAIFLAAYLAKDRDRIRKFFGGFLPAMLVLGAAAGLVLIEPDLGSALLLVGVMSLVLFVAGARPIHFAPFLLVGGMAVAYVLASHPYIMERLRAHQDPWSDMTGRGHQIRQSLVALGAGGWVGTGLGRGTQKLLFLPEGHTDFILANLGEELGFLGVAGVILLYLCLGLTGWRILRKCRDPFAFHLSFGLTAYILLQAAVNIAVVSAAVPTKGIPLPLLSYGGSSLMFTMASVGILIRIADTSEETERGECRSSSREAAPAAISFQGSR